MSKPVIVTYEVFVKAANELERENQRVSVHLVRAKVGGSNSTLMQYLRKWKEEKQLASTTDDDMSEPLRNALRSEFGRIAQKARARLENQLADEKSNTLEAQDLLSETEKRCTELQEQNTDFENLHKQTVSSYEKQIAGFETLLKDAQKREAILNEKIDSLQKSKHDAEVEAAVAKTRCETLEKELEKGTTKKQ